MTELNWPEDLLRRNTAVNRALLDAINDEDLTLQSCGGGWSVGEHLRHLVNFRQGWVSELSPEFAPQLDGLDTKTVQDIAQALEKGEVAALAAVWEQVQQGSSFQGAYGSHPGLMLTHIAIHDSHHRGQILATLREFGHTVDDNPIWKPWNELEEDL